MDANLNRATEGLRVCEEVTRFLLNNRQLTAQLKNIRHQIFKVLNRTVRQKFISGRQVKQDVGRRLQFGELERADYKDIFFANMQRVKESIRVLEEFSKLINISRAVSFKKIRYHVYEIEKRVALKLPSISYTGQRLLPKRRCRKSALAN